MLKKPPKNTKILQLSFDMNDEKQKNCYELISLVSRKKSRFISNLVDEFLQNHPNAKEKKTLAFFVEHYDELKNLSVPAGTQTLILQDRMTTAEDVKTSSKTKSGADQAETAAMGAFSV